MVELKRKALLGNGDIANDYFVKEKLRLMGSLANFKTGTSQLKRGYLDMQLAIFPLPTPRAAIHV